jgi:hypothetical protein
VADITNAVVLRVTASLESRRYLVAGREDEEGGDLLVRKQSVDRLAGQLCLAPQMVVDSFVFNAHQAGLIVRHKSSAKAAEPQEAPPRDGIVVGDQNQLQHDQDGFASSASAALSAADARDSNSSYGNNTSSEIVLTGLSAASGRPRKDSSSSNVSSALKRASTSNTSNA